MADLIQELEQAQEGSRRLDAKIAGAVNIAILMDEDRSHTGPHYTTNLQDALGLVPEGQWWCLSGPHSVNGGAYKVGPKCYDAIFESPIEAKAATPALALTIACLKARIQEPADG